MEDDQEQTEREIDEAARDPQRHDAAKPAGADAPVHPAPENPQVPAGVYPPGGVEELVEDVGDVERDENRDTGT